MNSAFLSRSLLSILVLTVVAVAGCAASRDRFLMLQPPGLVTLLTDPPRIELVGLARLNTDGSFNEYVDLRRAGGAGITLGPGSALASTGDVLHLRVSQRVGQAAEVFHVLIGGSNGGEIILTPGGVQVVAGWGYFIGSMPYGETTRTAAASDGTTFLLVAGPRGVNGDDQAALLKSSNGKPLNLDHTDRRISDVRLYQGQYVNVKATSFESPKSIEPDSTLDKLAKRANGLAADIRAKHRGFPSAD